MKKFEYCEISGEYDSNGRITYISSEIHADYRYGGITEVLNIAGQNGWELVALQYFLDKDNFMATFKREMDPLWADTGPR